MMRCSAIKRWLEFEQRERSSDGCQRYGTNSLNFALRVFFLHTVGQIPRLLIFQSLRIENRPISYHILNIEISVNTICCMFWAC